MIKYLDKAIQEMEDWFNEVSRESEHISGVMELSIELHESFDAKKKKMIKIIQTATRMAQIDVLERIAKHIDGTPVDQYGGKSIWPGDEIRKIVAKMKVAGDIEDSPQRNQKEMDWDKVFPRKPKKKMCKCECCGREVEEIDMFDGFCEGCRSGDPPRPFA